MIRLEGVSKTFEDGKTSVEAVKDVNLTIGDGEVFGVIGFSGAGKSTLVRMINLLERPTAGRVYVGEREMTALPERELRQARKRIGMIFQHFNLMKSRTVFSNVAYPLRGSDLTKAQKREKVMNLLGLVGLTDKENAYPAQLSGGQKQRVAIARALANDPTVLLCDEATSALDPQTTQDILRLIRDLNRRLNLTVVLITHEMAVVKQICTRVAVMEEGRVVEEGGIYDVFANPAQPITRRFIETTSNLSGLYELLDSPPESLGLQKGDAIVKMEFRAGSAGKAVVSELSRKFMVDISIIFGNIEVLAGTPLGTLVAVFRGDTDSVGFAVQAFSDYGIRAEVMKRV